MNYPCSNKWVTLIFSGLVCIGLCSCSYFQPGGKPVAEPVAEKETAVEIKVPADEIAVLQNRINEQAKRIEFLETSMNNQKAVIQDLENRFENLRELNVPVVSTAPETDQVNTAETLSSTVKKPAASKKKKGTAFTEPQVLYQEAREYLLESQFKTAAKLFKEFSEQYPDHDYADNALYWLGECYYAMDDYAGSIQVFKQLLDKYPKGGKVPDALLKIAYAYLELKDNDRAHHYLKQLIKNYPFTPAGEKAEQRLRNFM